VNGALDAGQRASLERLVAEARRILERDLASQAAGRYGIDADGTVAAEEDLRLDATTLAHRREIIEVANHLRSEGAAPAAAVARLLREAVFTHLNRLVAIRIAEAQGLLPPSLADGRSSQGFRDLLEAVPLLANDDTGGYWAYLQLCADELAADVPTLFDPRNPLLVLAPTPGALDGLTRLLAGPASAALWSAPDCLGWVYQFFNTREERAAMREASTAPRDSRELAVRNQFFTPRYVVDFLVQNSLGRRLIEANPDSPLLADLPLLIDPPSARGAAADLNEVTVLDRACGSGHFLLAAYDVLERAWHYQGVSPRDAASAIVRSLWGIDIDPRCAQVAAAAVMFRARRSCPDGDLPRPNIACARSLPATATGLDDVLSSLSRSQRSLIERLTEALADAPVLGSLLKIEETMAAEIKGTIIGGPALPGTFADSLPAETIQTLEDDLLANLTRLARATTASPAERLLAAEADDAIRFVQALQRRYDAVLMNPPFGEPVPDTKIYLKTAYPWIPVKDNNLLAAFVGRGVELCNPSGYIGAITSRTGMFLSTYADWRRQVVLGNRLTTLVDLGLGVMEQALVEAAAYVIGRGRPDLSHTATFVRLLRDTDRPAAVADVAAKARSAQHDTRIFRVNLEDLRAIPGSPLAYWLSPSIRRLFTELPPIEGNGAEVRVGLQTGDDFRFVRAFWEVEPKYIARSREQTFAAKRWCPFAKGGEYSLYWADIHLLVDYENDGDRMRRHAGAVIRNPQFYFRAGLTWPRRTASGFSPRILPGGCVFADQGPATIPHSARSSPWTMMAWLTSRLAQVLLASLLAAADETTPGAAAKHYLVGYIQHLPWPGEHVSVSGRKTLEGLAVEVTTSRAAADAAEETSRRFVAPAVLDLPVAQAAEVSARQAEDTALRAVEISREIDDLLAAELSLDQAAIQYLNEELGQHPARYPDQDIDRQLFAKWYASDLESVVDEVVQATSGGVAATKTYIADRRLELLAHGLSVSPRRLVQVRREEGLLPAGQVRQIAEDRLSYLLGCALGRWDVRIGRELSKPPPMPGLLEPVALCPPGMLIGPDGLPAGAAPDGYLLDLPPSSLLIDEPGHRWDIEAALLRAADALWDSSDQHVADLAGALGRRSLRDYMRRDFFKAHLSRYSKSRRKAPIYWPLYVPSGTWGVWAYVPALAREGLFAITRAAGDRLDAAEAEIRRLRQERQVGGAGRSARQVAAALESEERLAGELARFRDEAERIAGLGWEPDLDDGIILCAAPLAGIFPAWRDAAAARNEIRAGQYPWASVSRWASRL
jgi:hypothetical protein